ncbi:septal ring lytic transglycosylase RlpA family protein [Sinorhizobium medicae]|uniref:Endolytic peptidoglycan transglycosylase RlpA n=2 Tax=Sinorhizobium medicae TaxID=110321 RepID=A0A508WSR5_9HYPH|nr:septal ring lytic transglycosylase RlpA family protein [Sinorhizobium medicae]ABR60144.1 rare lipoprotein A [Sinorhizobium medicae WSM419]MBO1962273.1 septal ring lytic transglycosylase RlpA family protein [Sinorhizobium medicae]MDX0408711.1 septal ring lytic transglycosylase RlpA family protein [Sinorhizobium medicae]MDX0413874.1 septal ring lytic transglycosylase RlpA family protein [Sinorhizobium medicae]MDX0420646.1 septal ring lytic transglycosylase RlpA family protein [Sinorhizobium m
MTSDNGAAYLVRGLRLAAVPLLCAVLASCGSTSSVKKTKPRSKEYFAESVYGVKASPRVATGNNIPKGGGRYQVGKPYQVKGRWYKPKEDFGYNKSGMASWYGSAFHGRLTANGEVYDTNHLSAAHPTFPLPSYARVTNTENGTSVVVRVNDRGPYEYGRIIDVSSKTADLLDIKRKGSAKVRVQYIGRAPLEGNDMPYLMASYVRKGERGPSVMPEGQIATGVMVASNKPLRELIPDVGAVPVPNRSALEPGAPMNALAEPAKATAVSGAFDEFAILPEIGPVPRARPQLVPLPDGSLTYAAAYVEVRVSDEPSPFEAIMVERNPLTPESILAYAKRRHQNATAR